MDRNHVLNDILAIYRYLLTNGATCGEFFSPFEFFMMRKLSR